LAGNASWRYCATRGARAAAGQTVTVVLRGRRGSGARRLAAEFAAEVAELGGRVEQRLDGSLPSEPAEVPTLSVVTGCGAIIGGAANTCPRLLLLVGSAAAFAGAQVLDLRPLAAPDVRAILSTYLHPSAVDEALPAVLRESRGLPARVLDPNSRHH
jgi:hypothetical protein